MFRRLFALSEQGQKDLKKAIFASAAVNLSLMLPIPLTIALLLNLLKPILGEPAGSPNIWLYTGAAALVLILIYSVHYIEYKAAYIASYSESANRRIALAEKIRRLPLSFFGRHDLSELTTTMMKDCTDLEHTFSHSIPRLFGAVISISLAAVGAFLYDWRMSLAMFLPLVVSLALLFGSKGLQDKFGGQKIASKLYAADGIQEFLDTIKDLKACSKEDEYLKELDGRLDGVVRASIRLELVTGSLVSVSIIILKLGLATVVLTGALLLGNGGISVVDYLIFLMAASRIYDPLTTVFTDLASIFDARIQIRRMQAINNQPVQQGEEHCEPAGYDIEFKHVDFSYDSEKVLSDVSFIAKQGEVTALVGPSGSGKSTAAKLAARFWDADSGKITIGGVDVTTVEPETLLMNFAIVFQDVVLFNDSIMENIRLGRHGASDDEVMAAAVAAQCDSFVSALPDGYKTVIGENGATLSGGERQRISIARAILKDSPVILMDEATASLDAENETLIQSALSSLIKKKTVLVIAHRLRTVAGADRIIVLENGRIVEQGVHDELLEKQGLYRRLWDLQQQSAGWSMKA